MKDRRLFSLSNILKVAGLLFLVLQFTQLFRYDELQRVHSTLNSEQPQTAASLVNCPPNLSADNPLGNKEYKSTPLSELVETTFTPRSACNASKKRAWIENTILPESITHYAGRKIPKIVHITSKTKCTTKLFARIVDAWRFANYSLYYHDEAAVDRLLQRYWSEFPHLQLVLPCMISGAAKADLWRYLVLWEYGGIYTDVDNLPGPWFRNGTAITDSDDAWFVVEQIGVLSQYFMAASPRHPLLHMCVTMTFSRLMNLPFIRDQYVPFVTGPGALKQAFAWFMAAQETTTFDRVSKGRYVGVDGRSVTVVGTRATSNNWIHREAITPRQKFRNYAVMGMEHFSRHQRDRRHNDSCFVEIYRKAAKDYGNQTAT